MRERAGMVKRHRAVHVIPNRGRVGPVTACGFNGFGGFETSDATYQLRLLGFVSAFTLWSVTTRASSRIDLAAFDGGSAAFRQPGAIGGRPDVHGAEFFRRRPPAQAVLWGL